MNRFERDFLDDYSDESLLDEMRRVASLLPGPVLSIELFDRSARVSASTVRRRFGGWRNALAKAGLAHLYGGRTVSGKMKGQAARRMTNQGLLEEMRRVHRLLGKDALTAEDFSRHTQLNAAAVARRFGSWHQALEEAVIPRSQFATKGWKEQDCFENLASVWAHIGRRPKYSEMDATASKIPVRAYEQRWGSWRNALRAFLAWANEAAGSEALVAPGASTPDNAVSRSRSTRQLRAGEGGPRIDRREVRPQLRFKVLQRDRFKCVACGRSPATHLGVVLHADHILPVARGGETTLENLQSLCQDCNLGKGSATV